MPTSNIICADNSTNYFMIRVSDEECNILIPCTFTRYRNIVFIYTQLKLFNIFFLWVYFNFRQGDGIHSFNGPTKFREPQFWGKCHTLCGLMGRCRFRGSTWSRRGRHALLRRIWRCGRFPGWCLLLIWADRRFVIGARVVGGVRICQPFGYGVRIQRLSFP